MDISVTTDIQALKALAYDQMVLQEQVQRNLALITARIAELEAAQSPGKKSPSPPPGHPD